MSRPSTARPARWVGRQGGWAGRVGGPARWVGRKGGGLTGSSLHLLKLRETCSQDRAIIIKFTGYFFTVIFLQLFFYSYFFTVVFLQLFLYSYFFTVIFLQLFYIYYSYYFGISS